MISQKGLNKNYKIYENCENCEYQEHGLLRILIKLFLRY